MLIPVITNNLEVSLNLGPKEIKVLTDVDFSLLKSAMKISRKSSGILLLLELGMSNIDFILKEKRLKYLHFLLTTDSSSLLKAVWDKQVQSPGKGDWCQLVMKDLKELGIDLNFSQIAAFSKQKFKQLVKISAKNSCFSYLLKEKSKLSKGSDILYEKFETQAYLSPGNNVSLESMRKIYYIRCRQLFIKCNFPSYFNDKKCLAPHDELDEQKHLYNCSFFSRPNEICDLKYEEIFSNDVRNQTKVMKQLFSRLQVRESFLPSDGRPIDPSIRKSHCKRPTLGIREALKKNRSTSKRKIVKPDISNINPYKNVNASHGPLV